MNDMSLWIAELCICAAAAAIAENLLPEGNVKKSVYFILGLIIVTCFISPLDKIKLSEIDIPIEDGSVSQNTDWLNRTTEDIFKKNVCSLIEECLSKINVKAKKIDIHTDINKENCIFIDKVRITVSPDYADRVDEIADKLYNNLGLDADVNVRQ